MELHHYNRFYDYKVSLNLSEWQTHFWVMRTLIADD